MNISAEHVLKVKGSKGDVDVKFKLAGYNEEVLAKAGITNPVSSYIRQFVRVRKLSKYGISMRSNINPISLSKTKNNFV